VSADDMRARRPQTILIDERPVCSSRGLAWEQPLHKCVANVQQFKEALEAGF